MIGSSAPTTLLKSAREIEIMARGGEILHATLMHLKGHVRPGISTGELDQLCEAFIRSHAGAEPAFKGLYGFPGSACISINEEIVHGIPSRKRVLRDGDIVTLDVGVKLEGMYTDAAITVPVGEIDAETQHLLDVTRRSLDAGIAAAVADNHVGDIGAAVQAVVEAEGFAVVRELVGHGVGFSPHEELQIPNYGKPKRGKKLSVGLTIAIEPMVNVGTAKTRTLSDKWTVVTADGKRSAHFEHTVAITENGPRILT
ncbi:type I methionyl aminopeptidase [Gemmatimonas aurantiaca]|uniref:type I methionyl aminopeptidase n=1 Tax=Gemmatimonas aurantiaca TaxID=173480 RepID=UPI00301BA3E4